MAGLGDMMMAGVLRADDLGRAKKFYVDVLGLTPGADIGPGQVMLSAGMGTAVLIYERPGMPAPENTTLGFAIPADKFDAVFAELKSKGVMYEEYDMPEMGVKTVNGVAEMDGMKAAWFKDTEGNILNIVVM